MSYFLLLKLGFFVYTGAALLFYVICAKAFGAIALVILMRDGLVVVPEEELDRNVGKMPGGERGFILLYWIFLPYSILGALISYSLTRHRLVAAQR